MNALEKTRLFCCVLQGIVMCIALFSCWKYHGHRSVEARVRFKPVVAIDSYDIEQKLIGN